MRAPVTAVLVAAYLLGCFFVGFMGWLGSALTENLDSDEIARRNQEAVAAVAVLLLAIVMSVLLFKGRWRWALLAFALESGVGVFVLVRGLESSDHSDHWLYLLALGIALTGAGALTVARPMAAELRGSR